MPLIRQVEGLAVGASIALRHRGLTGARQAGQEHEALSHGRVEGGMDEPDLSIAEDERLEVLVLSETLEDG